MNNEKNSNSETVHTIVKHPLPQKLYWRMHNFTFHFCCRSPIGTKWYLVQTHM